jgi:hypothetical protein
VRIPISPLRPTVGSVMIEAAGFGSQTDTGKGQRAKGKEQRVKGKGQSEPPAVAGGGQAGGANCLNFSLVLRKIIG